MYGSNCKTAEKNGAKVLHGCRRCFHNDKIPAFKVVYKIFDDVRIRCFLIVYLKYCLILFVYDNKINI